MRLLITTLAVCIQITAAIWLAVTLAWIAQQTLPGAQMLIEANW